MTSLHTIQTSFLSGVLDPRAKGRVDTDAYNNGLLVGTNIEPVHLGGVQRRRGLGYRQTLPGLLTRLPGTYTAPNGGTASNASDDNETTLLTTTTTVGTTNPYVVVAVDLGSAQTVAFADVTQIFTPSAGGASTQFCIQYSSDNSNWTTLGNSFPALDTTTRAYRRAGPVSARFWRVAKIGGTNMGTAVVSLADFNLWADSGVVSAGRVLPYEVSTTEEYALILTDRSALIVDAGTGLVVDHQVSPYVSADLAAVDATANAESLIVVHENYPPRFYIRELPATAPFNFNSFIIVFDTIPQIDYGDTLSPTPTPDIQTLQFNSGWNSGDTFHITLDTDNSEAITYSGDNSTTATAIATAVQALWVVQGFTGVTCVSNGSYKYTLTLDGASADSYGIMAITSLSSSATASVTHTQTGSPRREDVWSYARGWPRTTEIFEGRLYFGGTKSQQESLMGSQVNNILYFDTGQGLDDDAIYITLNGRNLNAIQGLYAGRSFQMFTTGGEYRFVNDQGQVITPSSAPSVQTQYGGAKIRPTAIDGSTIFIQRNGKSVRDFRFDYTENAYNSLGVSALSPNLIYNVQDLSSWNGSSQDEINLVFVVNGANPNTSTTDFPDGTCAVYNTRKEVNTQAWTIWTTQGLFKGVTAVVQNILFLVQRTIGGVTKLFLEQADPSFMTDSAVQVANATPTAVITGLDHLNGQSCRVLADGFILANVTPVNGSATIAQPATNVEIGLDWTPMVTPMPLQNMTPTGTNVMRRRRIVKVRAQVLNTRGLLVNGRVIPDKKTDVDRLDQPASTYSGVIEIEESTNWDNTNGDKLVTFSQVDPLPFQLLSMDIQMESS